MVELAVLWFRSKPIVKEGKLFLQFSVILLKMQLNYNCFIYTVLL